MLLKAFVRKLSSLLLGILKNLDVVRGSPVVDGFIQALKIKNIAAL